MFAHLHTHSEYSLLDGMSTIPELVARARALGQEALAVTDHGALYGALKFYEEARAHDLNPIIGLEAYVAPQSRLERNPAERTPYHLTLLAQNETGYRNLLRLSSASHLEGFYYKPRVDRELLAAHGEGLIALSACPSGEVLTALQESRDDDAREALGWYRDAFPGRYYVELQDHGQEQFSRYTPRLVELARELALPLVLTNDSHYTAPEQEHPHDVLLCIGTNATVHETNRMKLEGGSFYLKSEQEMRALLPELPEASDNTARIAEQVEIRLDFGRTLLPDPGIPAGLTAAEHLRELCQRGLARRYPDASEEQRERLRYELAVIEETGFVEYILIVRDIARYAREQGIPMGVRGSAAASMALHCLDVTDIEPTQYRLVFERFLNLERREMPDVDFDFADDRREEVIRYAAERYGRDRVAQIVTFGTLGPKAAIRDTGRALGMSYGDVDRVARLVPNMLGVTLDQALSEVEELRTACDDDPQVRELIETARSLEGVARHASTHAAGVVISREPLADLVPLQRATSSKDDDAETLPTTQFDMHDVARIGLLKLDFLGLANLTILGKATELIAGGLDLETIPDGDEATAALLAEGRTFGVFQLEGGGMRRWVQELQPRDIRELAAMIALYRPGPMEHIPRYIDVKHGRAEARYPHADLAGVLDETYGVITYQDQVLEIAKNFAGYTLGQADVMRKAMGKKIPAVMLAERERFVAGSIANGYEQRLAEQLFDLIEPFAGYAFNKAHAFSYAVIAYHTAYLKAHYPVDFMTAVLMAAGAHPTGAQERIAAAIAECTRLDIEVLPPDVNASQQNFQIGSRSDAVAAAAGSIRFGLAQIKNVGVGAVEGLIAARAEGEAFSSIEDFARRVDPRDCNRRVLESLAKAGAFDSLLRADRGEDRSAVVYGVDRILTVSQEAQRQRETGQTSMFDLFGDEVDTPLPALELEAVRTPERELLGWERELLGTYVSAHPFREAAQRLAELVSHQTTELTAELSGQEAVVAGMVTSVRKLTTRQGKAFAAVTIEDLGGAAELTVWPDRYEQQQGLLVHGNVLLAKVDVRERGDRLTLAAEALAAYDQDAGSPLDFDAAQFVPGRGRRRRRGGGGGGGRNGNANGSAASDGAANGASSSASQRAADGGRPELRAVPASVDTAVTANGSGAATSGRRPATPLDGPARLRITMEETTDVAADRRRVERILRLIAEHAGQEPAELVVVERGGARSLLQLPPVADIDALVPLLRPLLGVLGRAERVGEEVAADPVLTAAGAV